MNLDVIRNKMKMNIGLLGKVDCTTEENEIYANMLKEGKELPENVFQHKTISGEYLNSFYKTEEYTISE